MGFICLFVLEICTFNFFLEILFLMAIRFFKVKIKCKQPLMKLPAKKMLYFSKELGHKLSKSFYFIRNLSASF